MFIYAIIFTTSVGSKPKWPLEGGSAPQVLFFVFSTVKAFPRLLHFLKQLSQFKAEWEMFLQKFTLSFEHNRNLQKDKKNTNK